MPAGRASSSPITLHRFPALLMPNPMELLGLLESARSELRKYLASRRNPELWLHQHHVCIAS